MSYLIVKNGQGASKEEAAVNVSFDLDLKFDATRAYKNFIEANPKATINEFAKEYLKNKVKDIPNVGVWITLETPVANTRIRPYKETSIPTTGKRHYNMAYQLVDQDRKVLAVVVGDKAGAVALSKDLMTAADGDITKIKGEVVKVVTEGEPLAFELEYVPTVGARDGSFIFFGYAAN